MEDQVGAAPAVFGQVEPPLELPPPRPPLLDPDMCTPELLPPPELELPPPEPLELEPPKPVTPELLEPELPNALTPELELPFPKPSPELLNCSPPLLEPEPLLVDPSPPSSARSSGPPSPQGST
jgi:protein TonB